MVATPVSSRNLRMDRVLLSVCVFFLLAVWTGFLCLNLLASMNLPKRLSVFSAVFSSALLVTIVSIFVIGIRYRWLLFGWMQSIIKWKRWMILAAMVFPLVVGFFYPDSHSAKSQATRRIEHQRETLQSIINTPGACYSPGKQCALPDVQELISPVRWRDFYTGMTLLSVMQGKNCLIYSVGPDGVSQGGVGPSVPDDEIGVGGLEAMIPSRFWKRVCKRFLPDSCRVETGDLSLPLRECAKGEERRTQ